MIDLDCDRAGSVDYPDFAAAVTSKVEGSDVVLGVLVCSTGIEVCITANKFIGVRAALCWNKEMAEVTRCHNGSNVLCLSGKYTSQGVAWEMTQAWLASSFEGVRHARCVNKVTEFEHPSC